MFGKGSTVLRGGYGIYYPANTHFLYFGNTAGFATTTTTYSPPGGSAFLTAFQFSNGFPTAPIQPIGARLGSSAFLGQGVAYEQPDEKNPMSQQWNLSLQQQLPGGWLLDATYTGNHVTHLLGGEYDLNQLDPQYLSLGTKLQELVPNPYAGKVPGSLGGATITRLQSLRPYPYYSAVTVRTPHLGNSIYHALLLSVEKRLNKGFVLLASYTKSKLMSDTTRPAIDFGGVEQATIFGYQNGKFDRRAERSPDPTDVADRLVISGVYELPFGRGKLFDAGGGFVNGLIGGWQINAIATIQSGLPLVVRGANNFAADRPNLVGNAKLDNPTARKWFNTDAFVNPPLYTYGTVGRVVPGVLTPGTINFDLSLIKDTRIRERVKLQFRVEAFNAFNHVNLGLPNGTFTAGADGKNANPSFGVITSARDARIVQFGLKLIY